MKLFTVEEANALLPSVRQLLRKLQRCRHRLGTYSEEARQAADQADQGGGGIVGGLLYARLLTNIAAEMGEIEAMGVQLKDFDRGLVDFPSLREGRVVLLCWQLDEGDELEWWHDMDAGFAGRTPL
ncbi:MAG TPA: DUF2203 domain-containing protein [Pyrinomonadaceae bacterium]|nr:DUF2203 domain-containing protein [Pyrinomonadaceae bacterium]